MVYMVTPISQMMEMEKKKQRGVYCHTKSKLAFNFNKPFFLCEDKSRSPIFISPSRASPATLLHKTMEASSIICASAPLQVKSKSPFNSSSSKNSNSVPSNRFIPTKNKKTVTLRCFHSHGRRTAAAPPRYFTNKVVFFV